MEVNKALGVEGSDSAGYNENTGRCILVDTSVTDTQCSAADSDDTVT